MKLDYFLIPYTKTETIKLLEGNIGSKLSDIDLSDMFLDMSPWAWETKEKLNKWDYSKLKRFFTTKKSINKTKRQST